MLPGFEPEGREGLGCEGRPPLPSSRGSSPVCSTEPAERAGAAMGCCEQHEAEPPPVLRVSWYSERIRGKPDVWSVPMHIAYDQF